MLRATLRNCLFATLAATTALSVSGCAQIAQLQKNMEETAARNRVEGFKRITDKHLVSAFYHLSADGKESGLVPELRQAGFFIDELYPETLILENHLYSGANWGVILGKLETHRRAYDAEGDEPAKIYIKQAKARGNIVRSYRPELGGILKRFVRQSFSSIDGSSREWFEVDNVLIEKNKSGKIISYMVRAHQAMITIGVGDYFYTTILYGNLPIRNLEDNVTKDVLESYYLRTL